MRLAFKKNIIFTLLLLIVSFTTYAQNTGTTAPPAGAVNMNDTLRSKKTVSKIRIVDGSAMSSAKDVIDNLMGAKEFSTFINAINTAGLTETFKTTGPITVFAPTNSAFAKLAAGKVDTLLIIKNKIKLINLLTYHSLAGKISSKDIEKQIRLGNGQATLTTIAGGKLTAKINENRNIVLTDENGGQSIVSSFDIEQSNGLLHIINAVLIPKDKL